MLGKALAEEVVIQWERLRGVRTDQAAWHARHDEVHDHLCRTSGRLQLEAECRRYRLAVQPYMRLYLKSGRTFEQPGFEHEHLVAALRSRDGEQAERLARSHILANAEAIAECLKL